MTDEKIFAWQTAGIWQGIPVESERYRMGNEIGGGAAAAACVTSKMDKMEVKQLDANKLEINKK